MIQRKTSRIRRTERQVLQLRVTTPRIVWFGMRDLALRVLKMSFIVAVMAAGVWGAMIGLRRAFLENEDFRLRAIDLNPNRAMDERRLVEVAGLDLNGSVFAVDIGRMERELEALPEMVEARVERKLPGTLLVRVHERVPLAWIACPAHGLEGRDRDHGLLIDPGRVVFPCVGRMRDEAGLLPVIVLSDAATPRPEAGKVLQSAELERCLRLLRAAVPAAKEGGWSVGRVEQANAWSMRLTTGDGIEAVFGLGEHERQLQDFGWVLAHAGERGQRIASVNLIPERNIPVSLREDAPPRAIPVGEDYLPPLAPEDDAGGVVPPTPPTRAQRDLRDLLDRG